MVGVLKDEQCYDYLKNGSSEGKKRRQFIGGWNEGFS
jgi:hypothetical protein